MSQRSPPTLSAEPEHPDTAGPDEWLISRIRDIQRSPKANEIKEAYLNDHEDTVGLVFKEAGVVPWMTYHCAKVYSKSSARSTAHTALRENLKRLQNSSKQHQQETAQRVLQHLPLYLQKRIESWHKAAMTKTTTGQSAGRALRADRSHSAVLQATDGDDDMPSTPNSATADDVITKHQRKRRRESSTPLPCCCVLTCGAPDTDVNDEPTPENTDRRPSVHHPTLVEAQDVANTLETSNKITDNSHVLYDALLSETSRLCPVYLAGAIRRIHSISRDGTLRASVSMTFPNEITGLRVGCQMCIEIEPNKIDHIASELFEAHFETDGSLRYLCLPGGSKVFGNPSTFLRGCRLGSIMPMFGAQLTNAISASPMCLDDYKRGHHHTDAVSMVVFCEAQKPATLMLSLDLKHGTDIANKIYKS